MSTAAKHIRVVLVDDHPGELRQTIQLLPEHFEVLETLEDGAGLLAAVQALDPEIIVLDITLPRVSGIDVAKRLRAAGCQTKIVFLTVHADADYARAAFAAGASGYVIKPRLASDLLPALEAALAGRCFVSPCRELQDLE